MSNRVNMIERAYQLARTGQFVTPTGVKSALRREGYSGLEPAFAGASFRNELRALIRSAQLSVSGGEDSCI